MRLGQQIRVLILDTAIYTNHFLENKQNQLSFHSNLENTLEILKIKCLESSAYHILLRVNNRIEIESNRKSLLETRPPFTCSKLTIETLEKNVKYVQS